MALAQEMYSAQHFHYEVNGGFWAKTLKEFNSDEVKYVATNICEIWAGNACIPAGEADQMLKKAVYNIIYTNNGPNEFEGAIRAPDGMKICQVQLSSYKLSEHSTFNGTLQDHMHQYAFYAHVTGTASGSDEIDATVVTLFIPENDKRDGCFDDKGVWLCGRKGIQITRVRNFTRCI